MSGVLCNVKQNNNYFEDDFSKNLAIYPKTKLTKKLTQVNNYLTTTRTTTLRGGATIGVGRSCTPHLFQIVMFLLY